MGRVLFVRNFVAPGVLNHAGSLGLILTVVDAFFTCFGEDKPSNSETPRFLKTLTYVARWETPLLFAYVGIFIHFAGMLDHVG